MSHIIICKNCSTAFAGHYCSHCGQKAETYRITFKALGHHIPHALFHIDSGFFYTVQELACRPGHAVREYLEGKRKSHFNPFLMLLLLGGFCSYLYAWFHFNTVIASVSIERLEWQNASLAHKYFAIRSFFFCLVCTIGDYLLFLKKGYTLPEIVVANTFMFCGVLLIQLVLFPLLLVGRTAHLLPWAFVLVIAVSLVYLVMARIQFYNTRTNLPGTGKILFAVMLYLSVVIMVGRWVVNPWLSTAPHLP